jgi:hypothetical protein
MLASLVKTILAWFGVGLVTLFSGWKSILVVSLVAFLTITAFNMVLVAWQQITTFAMDKISSTVEAANISGSLQGFNFTGFVGYMLGCFKVPEMCSFAVTIIMLKFVLRKIPFIRW